MANKTISMLQIRKILQLLERHISQREIAGQIGISRNTLAGYLRRFRNSGLSNVQLLELTDEQLKVHVFEEPVIAPRDTRYEVLAPRLPALIKELNRTGVTRYLLWQEYCREVSDPYSYQQFCFHITSHLRIHTAVMHFEHTPGQRAEMDFAGEFLSYVDRNSGEIIKCPVLVGVLTFSGYTYVEPLVSAQLQHLVPAMNECAQYFEGVPVHWVSDNMAQVVKSANRYEPAFTQLIEQWSVHYNVTFMATRVAKPRDKPVVEKAVDLAYKRIYAPLRNQVFHSLEELRRAVKERLYDHNHALLQKKNHSRYDLFLQEKTKLYPLPSTPFELKYETTAKVQKNYHVLLGQDWHYYSVPFQHIGKRVRLVYDADVVEVYDQLSRIALHKRNYRQHGYTTHDIHMPEKHLRHKQSMGWDQSYFLESAQGVGPSFTRVIQHILNSRHFTQQTFNSCRGLLRLKDRYGPQRLEAAAQRALQGYVINYRSIYSILTHGTDQQNSCIPASQGPPQHENIRGAEHYY
jgi:transposase